MAAVPDMDMAAIFAPLSGDNPSGPRMPPMTRKMLEDARKEFGTNEEDPTGPPVPKKPAWDAIIKTSVDTLTNTSKDLETAMRLLEALTRKCGFPGMTRGFEVLKGLVDNCWDYLHPIPDPQDGEGPEIRAEKFNWIGDASAGANFPYTVRLIPFLRLGDGVVSMHDAGKETSGATLETPTTFDDIDASHRAFLALDATLNEKLGPNAPGMVGLREALEQIHGLATRLHGSAEPSVPPTGPTEPQPAGATPTRLPGNGIQFNPNGLASREEAYQLISKVADALERIEPHSPIPDLLRRAVVLGRMPFRKLIKELISDGGQLSQVYKEFGIREDGTSS